MAVVMDLECSRCGEVKRDGLSSELDTKHSYCDGTWVWLPSVRTSESPMPFDTRDKCVIYVSDREGGRIQYPGRNDQPMPERLVQRGYRRVEMNPRELRRFERHHNVINERLNYDSNGSADK